MIFNFVPFHIIAEEVAMNLETHYDDVKEKDNYGRPNLDWEAYMQESLAGRCMAVTARDQEKLVGYSVFFIGQNYNHKTIKEASNAGIFIDKAYRGKIINTFLKKTDEFLRNIGVQETIYVLKDNLIGALLKRQKYQPGHIVWSTKYE